ncbi:hypothetical protein [Nostoc sp.]
MQYYTSAIAIVCLMQRYTRHFTLLSDRYNSLTNKITDLFNKSVI